MRIEKIYFNTEDNAELSAYYTQAKTKQTKKL